MDLPREVVVDIIYRLPVGKLIFHWKLFSEADVHRIARYNDLPLPHKRAPIYDQLRDLMTNSKLSTRRRMKIAAARGDIATVERMLELGATGHQPALLEAARHGHLEIVNLMVNILAARNKLEKKRRGLIEGLYLSGYSSLYNSAMYAAAVGGHREIVNLMLFLGADNYNFALYGAAKGGHEEIVKQMLSLMRYDTDRYDTVLIAAARCGHIEIVEQMLALGARDYDTAIRAAAKGGHLCVVDRMLSLEGVDYNAVLVGAARGGHQEIVDKMLALNADDYDLALAAAAKGGHLMIMEQMLSLGADDYHSAFSNAAEGGHRDAVALILAAGASDEILNDESSYASAAELATVNGHVGVLELLLPMIDTWSIDSLMGMVDNDNGLALVDLMIAHGGTDYERALRAAVGIGNVEVVERMLSFNVTNKCAYIGEAAYRGYVEVVDVLLPHCPRQVEEVLTLAVLYNHPVIVQHILSLHEVDRLSALATAKLLGNEAISRTLAVSPERPPSEGVYTLT